MFLVAWVESDLEESLAKDVAISSGLISTLPPSPPTSSTSPPTPPAKPGNSTKPAAAPLEGAVTPSLGTVTGIAEHVSPFGLVLQ